ncbi:MAG TPA: hypothetical protein VMC08_03915, partial [Bacteroidales bacterium]|nr:hypothetical protein [Bacteroidales bacterium]
MKRKVTTSTGVALLIFGIAWVFCLESCKTVKKEVPNRKVIVSNVGEVRNNVGYLEEMIHYRIYYCNLS